MEYTESDLDDLLAFTRKARVIRDFDRINDEIVLFTGVGKWVLPPREALLFLIGALKYRPDLLAVWSLRGRDATPDHPSLGFAA